MAKIFFRKTIAFLLIFLFISFIFIPSIERIEKNRESTLIGTSILNYIPTFQGEKATSSKIIDTDCYGFVIPLPSGEDSTYETFKNSKVRHIINDLLREEITVYWSSHNFSVFSKYMDNHGSINEIYYERGTFLVPFSGDIYKDTVTTAIVYDYNETAEIDDEQINIDVYKLMEPLDISGYKLNEPKIVQHLGIATRYGWPCYMQIAEAGGFLTFEYLLDDETVTELNNNDFNIFMWPYRPNPSTDFEILKTVINFNEYKAIRNFVKNGGGFIGSCYGAHIASSGVLTPIPLFFLRRYYQPNLSFIPFFFLSISDNLMHIFNDRHYFYITTNEIVNTEHPLAFGINKTSKEFFNGGWFKWLGGNSDNVGIFQDIIHLNGDKNVSPKLKESLICTPNWITSTFGKGKTVQFASHPEFVNNFSVLFENLDWEGDTYYGRRVIHNSLFFACSGNLDNAIIKLNYPVSFIEEIGEKTINLTLNTKENKFFNDIKNRINKLNSNLSYLRNTSIVIINQLSEFIKQSPIIKQKAILITRPANYTFHLCNIFNDLNNKSLSTLSKLEEIYPLLLQFNNSVIKFINDLKSNISNRLNHSEKLVSKIILKAEYLKGLLQNKRMTVINKASVFFNVRKMMSDFDIGLKYIPQIYYETLKTVRYCWYNYEANVALSFLNN